MADQRSSGNAYSYHYNQMNQVGGMSHTRTASGMDYHEKALHEHAKYQLAVRDQAYNARLTERLEEAMQKQEEQEQEEDIYYLLT